MRIAPSFNILPAIVLFATCASAQAAWNLDPTKSSIHFVSIKKDSVAEVHQFKEIAGTLSQSGEFMVDIHLSSVDTGVEIRDQRMEEHLFEVTQYPLAEVKGRVSGEALAKVQQGVASTVDTTLTLKLHGASVNITTQLNAVKLSPTTLLVTSPKPIIINSADFQLTAGVDKLKELVALPSIAYAVPVNVHLILEYSEPVKVEAVKP
jgi:polyisoprenoid-binding protein YceI